MGTTDLLSLAIMKGLLVIFTVIVFTEASNDTHPAPGAQYISLKLGCPVLETPLECFQGSTSCIAPDNTNIYKIVRARSWWHCGRACDPTTKCEYWTYRHGQRKCYLLKSCCVKERKGFQSGDQSCPVL